MRDGLHSQLIPDTAIGSGVFSIVFIVRIGSHSPFIMGGGQLIKLITSMAIDRKIGSQTYEM